MSASSASLRALLAQPAAVVAPRLLGAHLSANGVTVRIVEVEAYEGENDPASHAWKGRTKRNASMFQAGGALYVYFTYGMHWCLNVVCGEEGEAGAVLLRAGEIVEGEDLAKQRTPSALPAHRLASGPARLTRTLAIDKAYDGISLLAQDAPLSLAFSPLLSSGEVCLGPRIGVSQGADTPLRFWVAGSRAVSPYRPGGRRKNSSHL